MPDSIDVVIVAFNRYELTESCLRHLSAQTVDHRVIVLDNGSTDGTYERLQAEWPNVHLAERFDENRGFAEACNRGVAAGSGEVVVLLNNDVDCRPDFLERLVAPLHDPAVGSVAPLMLQPGEELIDSVGLTADVTLSSFPRLQGLDAVHARSERPVLLGPAGTAAAYRRSAWEQVGGLDEMFLAYQEDFDLALRLRAAGWGTAAATDAVGVHLGSATLLFESSGWKGAFGRGYMLRRYGLLRGRTGPRTFATECVVALGDIAIFSHDLVAFRARLSGWRAGRHMPRLPHPPPEALDRAITFRDSFALRRVGTKRAHVASAPDRASPGARSCATVRQGEREYVRPQADE